MLLCELGSRSVLDSGVRKDVTIKKVNEVAIVFHAHSQAVVCVLLRDHAVVVLDQIYSQSRGVRDNRVVVVGQ